MQSTKTIKVDPRNPSERELMPVAAAVKAGELVVFPTDTVYGIGANALNPKAVLKVFKAKDRPVDKPLILLIAEPQDAERYAAQISSTARKLMKEYWPGPLTLIFKRSAAVLDAVTAGGETVGIRCPDNDIVRLLIKLSGVALATTSANIAGKPSPKTAKEVEEGLRGKVAYIVDGGQTKLGVESTVVDVSTDEPRLIREGYIPWEEVLSKLGLYK
ncbi:MAG: threonylcarbamoyl-AMP synthase [Firmicutes bacterium]|nr:threonylcarbamoyl-AMP synthase [Bacillota bacterium]